MRRREPPIDDVENEDNKMGLEFPILDTNASPSPSRETFYELVENIEDFEENTRRQKRIINYIQQSFSGSVVIFFHKT